MKRFHLIIMLGACLGLSSACSAAEDDMHGSLMQECIKQFSAGFNQPINGTPAGGDPAGAARSICECVISNPQISGDIDNLLQKGGSNPKITDQASMQTHMKSDFDAFSKSSEAVVNDCVAKYFGASSK